MAYAMRKGEDVIFLRNVTEEEILGKIEELKIRYPMVTKNSTIDVVGYIFQVNRMFFNDGDITKKVTFLFQAEKFVETECGDDAVLLSVGHDDGDGFHVHVFAVPVHDTAYQNRHERKMRRVVNFRGKYAHSRLELHRFREDGRMSETKTGKLQTRWAEFVKKSFPDLERGKTSGVEV